MRVCCNSVVMSEVVHWSARSLVPGTEGHFSSLWNVFEV